MVGRVLQPVERQHWIWGGGSSVVRLASGATKKLLDWFRYSVILPVG